ncbi:MAG: lipid A export permease/ATP-binding protein MsbA [Proteobacteria bacterium]|nr:lipid A export permease/ATP-binding protein MsbA [Pseudomonadota bacterium]
MSAKRIYIRIFGFIKPYRSWLASAMVCMVMVSILTAGQAYMLKPLVNEIFFNGDHFMLMVLPPALILLFLVKGLFDYSYKYLLQKVGQSVIRDLRNKLYGHIQSQSLSFFHKTPTGELISRIISDVTLIQGAVSNVLVGILKDTTTVIALLGVILYLNWQLALMSMVLFPIIVYPIVKFGRKHRKLSIKNQQTTAQVSNILYETITGNRIVKAFCMERYEKDRFAAVLDHLFRIIMRDTRIKAVAHPLMEFFAGIGIALVLWYGGNQVLNGVSTPGDFFSFMAALIMVYEPLKGISKINSTLQQGIAATERVFNILDIEAEVAEKKEAVELAPIQESIGFHNVSFQYDEKTKVIKDINLQVPAGEVLALVGSSGGGKSTLVNLIPRFFDVNSGAITIDNTDIRDVTLKSLRDQIGIVTQQTILFNDTVRNNIAYGSPDASEDEIAEAARAAHALGFIERLPEGFDTVIGESGAKLSGGERQRVSIARAILKNAPILILDEATSSLDTESEREVQQALENLMQNRTTLVIAHRLSTIRNADRIIVIQDGRIVEEGTHNTLLPQGGVYSMLHDMQFQDNGESNTENLTGDENGQ